MTTPSATTASWVRASAWDTTGSSIAPATRITVKSATPAAVAAALRVRLRACRDRVRSLRDEKATQFALLHELLELDRPTLEDMYLELTTEYETGDAAGVADEKELLA